MPALKLSTHGVCGTPASNHLVPSVVAVRPSFCPDDKMERARVPFRCGARQWSEGALMLRCVLEMEAAEGSAGASSTACAG